MSGLRSARWSRQSSGQSNGRPSAWQTGRPNGQPRRQLDVSRRRGLAIIGDLAGLPQPRDIGRGFGVALGVGVALACHVIFKLMLKVPLRAEPSDGRVGAQWLVELGEASRFWPADEALATLGPAAQVVYENN